MPWLVTLLGGLLATITANLVAKVITAVGFSVITYVGIGFVVTDILQEVQNSVSAVPAAALQTMALVKLDVAINIIVSCALLKFGLFSVNGLISKLNFNSPSA